MLVSAIMPTRGRASMARQAIYAFMAQTYEPRELIVLDDPGLPSLQPTIAERAVWQSAGVRLFYENHATIGAKRNAAIQRSSGEVILHWDDDDLYHPERIERQVKALLATDADIVGFNSLRFREGDHRWTYHGRVGYAVGVSLCYRRAAWEQQRFEEKNEGEDNDFQFNRRVVTCEGGDVIVARIHPGNTSVKQPAKNPQMWSAA